VALATCKRHDNHANGKNYMHWSNRNADLLVSAGSLMAMWVVHRFAVKLRPVLRWMLAARRHGPVIAFAIVEMMIDVSVEMLRPVEPGSRADENTAREPLRAIVAVRSTVVRGGFVIPVRTNWRLSNADRNLCAGVMRGSQEKARGNSHKTQVSQFFHNFYLQDHVSYACTSLSNPDSRGLA
jgi:hypothetical protein